MHPVISCVDVNIVTVVPTPHVTVSPSVRVPCQDTGRTICDKMVTQQQDRLDLRGAGELRMGPDQLEEAGHFGIATPLLPNKSKFLFNQYGPLLALIYFHVTQSLLFNSYVLLTTRSVISMLQNVLHTFT